MAKGAYVGIDSKSAKIKKIYLGVDGVARKIKRAYVGVNGVAQLWWSGGEVEYYGQAHPLSVGRTGLAATTVGNYALFAGGANSDYRSSVDAYSSSLTWSISPGLNEPKTMLAATTVGNYALFAGGYRINSYNGNTVGSTSVDAYDQSLTMTTATSLSKGRANLVATTVGNYALFAGGSSTSDSPNPQTSYYGTVNAYDQSLTMTIATSLSNGKIGLAATTIGNYALFGGGRTYDSVFSKNTYYDTVDVYNQSLTRTIATSLSNEVEELAATAIGNYALFGGGYIKTSDTSSVAVSTVDTYSQSLTKGVAMSLSRAMANHTAVTIGDYALFGRTYNTSSSRIDTYDRNLTRSTLPDLSKPLGEAATVVGNYALFSGGYAGGEYISTVNVYTID